MPDKEEKPKKKQNQPKHHAPKSRAIAKMRRKKIYKYIAEGKTHQEAGELVGFSKKTARQQVEGILSQPIFKAEFQKILDKDVPDKDLSTKFKDLLNAKKVISATVIAGGGMAEANSLTKDFIEVDDCPTQLKTAEAIAKLKGHLSEKLQDVNFNFSTITDEQLADIIAGKMPKDIV